MKLLRAVIVAAKCCTDGMVCCCNIKTCKCSCDGCWCN